MHEVLQWICNQHVTHLEALPLELIENRLQQLGLPDEIRHEARNEYELLIEENGDIATRIIDRTFCDKGTRWIIDFKTGRETADTQKKHRHQVNEYARILSLKFAEPIRCGLYYLANNHWDTWEY